MGELDAFIGGFVIESRDNLDQVERDLVALEQDPTSNETLASVFRAIHTIKGAAGFLGLAKLGAVAHAGESLLSRLRDGQLVITPEIASGLLALVDHLRCALATIDKTHAEDDADETGIVRDLTALQEPRRLPHVEQRRSPSPEQPDQSGGSLRVDVEHLDKLMNLVGELVLTRNEMLEFSVVGQNPGLSSTSQRLNTITTQLQEAVMKTRMQPIDCVWNRFPRMVRDLALQCGKRVRLELAGKETELDKALIEAIRDPLTHLLRNSIDHGVETPDARGAAGKDPEGCVSLRAYHEGGQVNIEISDDGAGIDVDRVRQRALERRVITAEQARVMSEQDALNLIFLPGFSTAETITEVSGRGVGMDVVKTNIERIGGKIGIHTGAGLGTTLRIRIPLTLAIMPALIVTSGGGRYAIPQVNVVELLRFAGEEAAGRIEMIQDAAVYRLRGALLPLIWLETELAARSRADDVERLRQRRAVHVVVVQVDDCKYGLIVDDVDDTQEIVVKPLGKRLRTIATFAGATILGDGDVVLILDVLGLAIQANVRSAMSEMSSFRVETPQSAPDDAHALLLVAGADDARMAIPVSQVTRLERVQRSAVERSGGRRVVQYRGEILPVVGLTELLSERRRRPRRGGPARQAGDVVEMIVFAKDGRRVGLVVDRILDTVEHYPAHTLPASRRGVVGSMVIHGRVTEILDLDALCAALPPGTLVAGPFQEVTV